MLVISRNMRENLSNKYHGKLHKIYKTENLVNCRELLHPRLPTDEATKSIYDDTDTSYK